MKLKIREVIGFISLLVMFITLVMCKNADETTVYNHPVKDLICPHRSNVLGIVGVVFLGMIVVRFYHK